MQDVLDGIEYERLRADIEHICAVASIPEKVLRTSMTTVCGDAEISYVKDFPRYRAEGVGGLLLSGENSNARCMAICGALIRNFTDARVVSVNALIAEAKNDRHAQTVDATVLVVPNLFIRTEGKAFTSWQIQSLYDQLIQRFIANRPVVAYVENLGDLAKAYGKVFSEHLEQNFLKA